MTQMLLIEESFAEQQPEDDIGAKPAKVHLGPKVLAYRRAVWNSAAQRTLLVNPALAQKVLLAFMLSGNANYIKDHDLAPFYKKVTGEEKSIQDSTLVTDGVAYALAAVDCLNNEEEGKLFKAAAMVLMPAVGESKLKTTLQYLGVNLGDFWAVDAELLAMLTKQEIIEVAKEIGVDRYMRSSVFSKASCGKKEEFVRAIIGSGFDFCGKIPSFMLFADQE